MHEIYTFQAGYAAYYSHVGLFEGELEGEEWSDYFLEIPSTEEDSKNSPHSDYEADYDFFKNLKKELPRYWEDDCPVGYIGGLGGIDIIHFNQIRYVYSKKSERFYEIVDWHLVPIDLDWKQIKTY